MSESLWDAVFGYLSLRDVTAMYRVGRNWREMIDKRGMIEGKQKGETLENLLCSLVDLDNLDAFTTMLSEVKDSSLMSRIHDYTISSGKLEMFSEVIPHMNKFFKQYTQRTIEVCVKNGRPSFAEVILKKRSGDALQALLNFCLKYSCEAKNRSAFCYFVENYSIKYKVDISLMLMLNDNQLFDQYFLPPHTPKLEGWMWIERALNITKENSNPYLLRRVLDYAIADDASVAEKIRKWLDGSSVPLKIPEIEETGWEKRKVDVGRLPEDVRARGVEAFKSPPWYKGEWWFQGRILLQYINSLERGKALIDACLEYSDAGGIGENPLVFVLKHDLRDNATKAMCVPYLYALRRILQREEKRDDPEMLNYLMDLGFPSHILRRVLEVDVAGIRNPLAMSMISRRINM